MGRTYAGILGAIAFGAVLAQSLIHGYSVTATLYAAPLALFTFAAVGLVIGFLADRTIVEAIEYRFHAQLRAEPLPETGALKGMKPARGGNASA